MVRYSRRWPIGRSNVDAVHAHDGRVAGADTETEATAGCRARRRRLLGHHHRVSRPRRHHGDAELDGDGRSRGEGEGHDRVEAEGRPEPHPRRSRGPPSGGPARAPRRGSRDLGEQQGELIGASPERWATRAARRDSPRRARSPSRSSRRIRSTAGTRPSPPPPRRCPPDPPARSPGHRLDRVGPLREPTPEHGRVDRARVDGVDAHALAGELDARDRGSALAGRTSTTRIRRCPTRRRTR